MFTQAMDEWITWLALFLPRLLSALGLLLIGWLVGRLVAGILRRLARRLGFERRLAGTGLSQAFEQAGLRVEVSDILARLVFWLILLAFGLPAADALGLQAAADGLRTLVGYIPHVQGYHGTLEAVDTLRATISTEEGQVTVPNCLKLMTFRQVEYAEVKAVFVEVPAEVERDRWPKAQAE
jgi:hypothetical protein